MIIEVDEYKKQIPGYDPEKSEDFHSESAKLANKEFDQCLKSGKYNRIIFMAGGTASGKTEFAQSYFWKKDQLVYDGTLKHYNGFDIKVRNIKRFTKNNAKIKVVLIIPQDIQQAFEIFLTRERKMKSEVFFETHRKSVETVAEILLNTKYRVEIYVSELDSEVKKLKYKRLKIISRFKIAKFLQGYGNIVESIGNVHL